MTDERGAGAVLVLAIVAATTVVMIAVLALGAALVVRQRVIGAADAAALAAADAASGAIPGVPCAQAERIANANAANLQTCVLDGLVASVTVAANVGVVPVSARSTAGPPP